jgi:hypothetical protein
MTGPAIGLAAAALGGAPFGAPCPAAPIPPPPAGPSYALVIHVHRNLRGADGTEAVTFRPEVATGRIVFRLWANGPAYARRGARLAVGPVTAGGQALPTTRENATTLVVDRPLAAGERLDMRMRWSFTAPRGDGQRMHGGSTMRLATFFPLLAWDGATWQTDPPTTLDLGESWTSPSADFDVRVTRPAGLGALATGDRVGPGHWRARAVRDFALAVGRFHFATGTVRLPAPVRVVVGVQPAADTLSPRTYLATAERSLRAHSRRFGAYPWRTFSVGVMADLPDPSGFEYPGLVFVSDGGRQFLIPHETGHQWFYSLVGNDQSRDPWLDEGLASWADARADGALQGYLATGIPEAALNRLGEPMSFWDPLGFQLERYGIYVQGVQALASLGTPAEVDCALRAYVTANAYRTATPDDLLAALLPFFPDARAKLGARGAVFSRGRR